MVQCTVELVSRIPSQVDTDNGTCHNMYSNDMDNGCRSSLVASPGSKEK